MIHWGNETDMKRIDKIKALLRSNKYIHDYDELYEKIRSLSIKDDEDYAIARDNCEVEFCAKWRIPEVYHPSAENDHVKMCEKSEEGNFEEDTVEEIWSIDEQPLEETIEAIQAGRKSILKFGYKGEYLFLKVDVRKKKKDLMARIEKLIDKWQKRVPMEKSRNKATLLQPWEIYDMKHKEKRSLIQIAKAISGINDNPAVNIDVARPYKAIERAYKKAIKMIQQVENARKQ